MPIYSCLGMSASGKSIWWRVHSCCYTMRAEKPMKHVIEICLLVGIAFLFKWWIHSEVNIAYTSGNGLRGVPLNVVVFWILLGIAVVWSVVLGLTFVFSHKSGTLIRK